MSHEVESIGRAYLVLGRSAQPSMVLVLSALLDLIPASRTSRFTLDEIAQAAGVSRCTVKRMLVLLEARGVIWRQRSDRHAGRFGIVSVKVEVPQNNPVFTPAPGDGENP